MPCSPAWPPPIGSSRTCGARSRTCATIPTATARSARSGSAWAAASSACWPATSAPSAPGSIYYGTPPPTDRLGGIACPLLGIYGGDDGRITSAVPAFAEAMSAAGKRFDHHVYPGAPHAFFNDTRPAYRVAPARDAWARTLAFLVEQLG